MSSLKKCPTPTDADIDNGQVFVHDIVIVDARQGTRLCVSKWKKRRLHNTIDFKPARETYLHIPNAYHPGLTVNFNGNEMKYLAGGNITDVEVWHTYGYGKYELLLCVSQVYWLRGRDRKSVV